MNTEYLVENLRVVKPIEQASVEITVSKRLWLHMHLRKYQAEEMLFHKGAITAEIVYAASRPLKLQDIASNIGPGEQIS
jgi:hypothetical protein